MPDDRPETNSQRVEQLEEHVAILERQLTEAQENQADDSRARFAFELAEASDVVLWLVAADMSRLYYVSPSYEEMFGRSCADLYANPAAWFEAIHPEDRPIVGERLRKRAAGTLDSNDETEYRIVRPDGKVIWMRNRIHTIRDGDGKVNRLAGFSDDITQRKEMELALARRKDDLERSQLDLVEQVKQQTEELHESEAKWRAITESSPDHIILVDRDARIRYINHTTDGITTDQVLGTRIEEWVPNDYRASMLDAFHRVFETGKSEEYETCYITPDGSTQHYSTQVGPILGDGQVVSLALFARDVTVQKGAEQKLRLTEFAVENAADAIFWVRPNASFFSVNETACRRLGYTREELLEMSVPDVNPQYGAGQWPALWNQLRETSASTFESRHRTKDGEVFPVEITAQYLKYEDNEFACAIVRDITERKRQEEKLQSEERLLRKLLDIQERERRMVSHDIHDGFVQDVVGAQMRIEGMRWKLAADVPEAAEEIEKIADLLKKAVDEARRVISGLRPMIIDDEGLIEGIRHLVADRQLCQDIDVRFQCDVAFDRLEPTLETAVFRIVQEALTNVRRHSNAKQADVALAQTGEQLQLEIRDEGTGFDPQAIADDRFGVRGMRERARLFGGHADIKSTLGEGTRISVAIPISTDG